MWGCVLNVPAGGGVYVDCTAEPPAIIQTPADHRLSDPCTPAPGDRPVPPSIPLPAKNRVKGDVELLKNRRWRFGAAAAIAVGILAVAAGAAGAAAPPYLIPGPQPEHHIIGGYPVTDQTPVVALYDDERFICGGTLVADPTEPTAPPDRVLTAAHCASKLPETEADLDGPPVARDMLTIRAGSVDRTAGELRQVVRVALEPNWAWSQEIGSGDLAVLHLNAPVQGVVPARIGSPDPGQPVRVVGWGQELPPLPSLNELLPPPLADRLPALPDLPRPDAPRMLNKIDLWRVESSDCPPVQPGIGPGETCLAANGPVMDTCNGDSGTPGLQNGAVVAIVSRGTAAPLSCGLSHTVTTDPGYHRAWIEKEVIVTTP